MVIGVLGAGTMGAGIAQLAAQNGHKVILVDKQEVQLKKAKDQLALILLKLIDKHKITSEKANEIQSAITYSTELSAFSSCGIIIEAILEQLDVKHSAFEQLEKVVSKECILASNTSSLSIASIGGALQKADRVLGIHFFNPAPLMPLVEVIPAVQTNVSFLEQAVSLMKSWDKTVVVCKDTPGFIVNRVARPFYGEALRIYEEGIADFATIDWAMTEIGGFKMGPFTLMDYIGNDVNYAVTTSIFEAFYYDPRFKPSFTQKRHSEAGFFGRKSGRGYFDYSEGAIIPTPVKDYELGQQIVDRILAMLINEAYDAVFMQVATAEAVDLAMTKGVNYPKGLIQWSKEIGTKEILSRLEKLFADYGEDRYRPNPLLRKEVLH
ncbi:MAG: NAD(P)-binding domain-containing protein [Bacteroidetes bacterium]|nr:NAD(P)-binding domain-containing protein [Bacteroidota bacterium]